MRFIDILFAVTVALMWGGNFIAAKYAITYFPSFFVTALRFIIVATVLIPFVPRPSRAQMKRILPVAVTSSLHFSLMYLALSYHIEVASCAVIGQMGVPFACILGAIFLRDRIGIWRISGIVIAFVGIGIVAGTPNLLSDMTPFYIMIASTFCWGCANVFIKRTHGINNMALLAWVSLFTVPILLCLSFLMEGNQFPLLMSPPLVPVLGLCYTAVCSTIIAYGLWYRLIAQFDISQVAPFSLLTPIFGTVFAQLFFQEALTLHIIAGGILTIAGVGVIVLRRPKTIPLGEAT